MAKNPVSPLHLPPFPPLEWDETAWIGEVVLQSWRGFQSRRGPYASRSAGGPADGAVQLRVESPGGRTAQPPSDAHVEAFRYLLENEDAIRDTIVAAIYQDYPARRKQLRTEGLVEEAEMPFLSKGAGQLRSHIELSGIHVLAVTRENAAYVGFTLDCTWDEEHGLGLMMHQGRLVPVMGMTVAGADIASEAWGAEEDAKLPDPTPEEEREPAEPEEDEDLSPTVRAQRRVPRCTWCRQTADKVGGMVAGPADGVYLCHPCAERTVNALALNPASAVCSQCRAVYTKLWHTHCPVCGTPR